MNTPSSSMKTGIIIVVIVLIALGLYFYYSGKPSSDSSATTAVTTQANDIAGARVLALLNIVNSLNIDRDFFDAKLNPAYASLVDHTIEIPPVNVGRPNPFAPLTGQSASVATTTKKTGAR